LEGFTDYFGFEAKLLEMNIIVAVSGLVYLLIFAYLESDKECSDKKRK